MATYGTLTVDGNLTDAGWSGLRRYADTTAGYEVYGRCVAGAFVFALKAPTGVAIGANTSFLLNTDLNPATGYSLFGSGGAEYSINIDADGVARLYAGAPGGTLAPVSTVDYARSADGTIVEFAVAASQLGGAGAASIFAPAC
jgi:hypothetical protein